MEGEVRRVRGALIHCSLQVRFGARVLAGVVGFHVTTKVSKYWCLP